MKLKQLICASIAAGELYVLHENETLTSLSRICAEKLYEQAAFKFFKSYDSNVSVQKMPIAAIDELGLPSGDAAFLKHVWEICDGFNETFIANDTYRDLGEPLMDISEFSSSLQSNA